MKNQNGSGTIYKLSGNRRKPYVAKAPAVYNEKGFPIQKVIGYYQTKKEALMALGEYLRTPYNLEFTTIDELIPKILLHANLAKNTNKNYITSYNKYLKSKIGKIKASDLKLAHVQNILDNLSSTRNGVLSMAKLIARYLVEFEYINRPFADFLSIPKAEKVYTKTIFTREEIHALYKLNDDFSKAFLVYLFTGFRKDELLMAPKSIYHSDPLPYLQTGFKTQAGTNRIVPIHPIILPIINEFLAADSDYFFPQKIRKLFYSSGTRATAFQNHFSTKHCLHETRHTFRTELDKVESNVTIINKLMGHAGSIGEKTYTHKSIEELYQTIIKINFGLSVC